MNTPDVLMGISGLKGSGGSELDQRPPVVVISQKTTGPEMLLLVEQTLLKMVQ